jgi:hypothetical protein
MDWMYQGGMVAKAEANKRVEEQQAAQPSQPSNVGVSYPHAYVLPAPPAVSLHEGSQSYPQSVCLPKTNRQGLGGH